ncbi:MAG: hypothetical protein P8Y98_15055 [Anaerolineales bacterium]
MVNSAFRPFGFFKGDLDIDFDSPRPQLVSEVLYACLANRESIDPAILETLSVGDRLALLLELVRTNGHEILVVNMTCDAAGCGQSFEVDVKLAALQELQRRANKVERVEVHAHGARIILRRPTAQDQYRWQRCSFEDSQQAAEEMVQSLLVESEVELALPIPEAVVLTIEEAMLSADPLIAPTVTSKCPYCGQNGERPMDLGRMLLAHLKDVQSSVIDTIHRLAKSYHWTEDEILALPAKRKEQYLKLIGRER